jgi:hypothetical protein
MAKCILAATALFVLVAVPTCESRAQNDTPNSSEWPVTVEEAVRDILLYLPTNDKIRIRNTKKEDLISYHLDLGMGIRNRLGLWRGNDKLILSACSHPCHPDDAAIAIIEALWNELRK